MNAYAPMLLPMIVLVTCVAVPVAFMRMLAPSLAQGRRVSNYRGRQVYAGLGIVWIIWAGCAIVCGVATAAIDDGTALVALTLIGPLALVAASLGLVDDAYGTVTDRGFRGHFRALARGRVTTGMLKLIGIGAASLVVAAILGQIAPWQTGLSGIASVAAFLLAAAAIALTANVVNLTDLRPGRALKVYALLVVIGVAFVLAASLSGTSLGASPSALAVLSSLSLLLALLGPVFAVWRYDLGEHGMLGDAGSNAMGAVAGAVFVLGAPLWALALYAAAMLVLNIASEKVSFSAVIERTGWLHRIDRLGRGAETDATSESQESSATPTSDVVGSRYHLEDDHDSQEV
ncbi:MAG: hypothetical protein CVT59_01950 [Actinobacteria bacterium HGW-Actinobacteria-1]|jgi:UDP-N-acetylmuramyl pentapeptide phosphotransferase/UDP-N-acetylglucosamine-1-phosphate transferase|nr:MAG: hypothetical protein CVT59_01950 [Actinobacteria bacterium HGW-Actinobacteria-1]